MVDVVITYVDGDKGNFKNDYNKLIKKEYNELRFRSYGVLDLQIKLIRKYMSFVDNIFVIVSDESQIPDNFDRSLCKFIYHKDIIPQKYLPTFNSCCIEMFMHKIPELNNKFIYFNDDIFCIDTLSEDDFFINDKPCLYPLTMPYNKDESIYINNLYNSTQEIANLYKTNKFKDKYIKHTHIARPFIKTTCQKVSSFCKDDILNSLTRTRHSRNFNATLFNNYDYVTNKYIYKKLNSETFNTFFNECINYINDKSVKIVCINDNDIYTDFDEFKEDLKGSLEANLYNIKYVKPVREKKNIIEDINQEIYEEPIKDETHLKVALCVIAKNENLYIREWVEWYKNLGISKIFLYDNNEINGERFEDVINDYIENGFVEIINVRGIEKGCVYDEEGINLQPKCYIDCYKNKLSNFDWVCFFDVDEFLSFKENYNLFNFLNQSKFINKDLILISWDNYDDNNLIYYENKPVVKRFTHLSKLNRHGVKSIVRTNKDIENIYQKNLIHIFRLKGNKTIYCNGLEFNDNKIWYLIPDNIHMTAECVLNHYKTKTIYEYLYRHLGRHWGTGKEYTNHQKNIDDCISEFFKYNEKTKEKIEIFNKYKENDLNFNINEIKNQIKQKEESIYNNTNITVVLCTMGKNENLYIREFVEYYKKLGIFKIFLYDNNEINGERFEDVINDYIESDFVKLIDCRGKTKYQLEAYIDFYNNESEKYDWCCFFDIDEFLVLNEDNNINSYLNRKIFNDYESIAINWRNYGDNDLIGYENNFDRKCLSRFTKEIICIGEKYSNEIFKKIIRGGLRKIKQIESPHTFSPSLDKKTCNNIGQTINSKKFKCEVNFDLAYLKHFCTKTILEFILKAKRGGGVNGITKSYANIENFFKYNIRTEEKENIIKKAYSNNDKINLCVVNYNTPELINYLIKSIKMHILKNWHLYIFDNSDKTECVNYKENNITVFNNTKGQIINFNIWLEQFPDRLNCWAKNNGWGSAKHCYSVEKCMELINDNFILLDSDILLKKDISEFYRNDLFYVGDVTYMKTQKLPRISPFVCFINVNLCKLYNIHYFYGEYMHGLSKAAHDYDTGGAFYKFVNKYQHLNIKHTDYIVHFGQGSWQEAASKSILKKTITIEDWLKEYNYLYDETALLRKNVLEFTKKFNHNINLDNPITIQDKINWLKIYDVNELKGKCSDKIRIHEYSIEKLGKDICIPILKVYNSPDDINLDDLPDKFVLKCNHGYNMNIICKDKKSFNLEEAKEKCKDWLNKDFGKESLQLQYSLIDRKCFIEKYMSDENQIKSLYDYKFWCFNGEPKLYTINSGNGHGDILYYNMDQSPFDPYLLFKNKNINTLFNQPINFELMRIYAKVLSSDFKFVRVDFYEINNIVYLGELTFTPGNGIFSYKDKKYNKIIGDLLNLNE